MIQVGIPGLQAWGIDEKNAHAVWIQVLSPAEKMHLQKIYFCRQC
jgi:hypothetical protein